MDNLTVAIIGAIGLLGLLGFGSSKQWGMALACLVVSFICGATLYFRMLGLA